VDALAAVNLLSASGLVRDFGGLRAIDDVALQVSRGEIRAVIGPEWRGEDDAGQPHMRPDCPQRGRIIFDGEDITGLPGPCPRGSRGIAYTFQITSVFGNLSAFDNVALAVQNSMQRGRRFGGSTRPRCAGACSTLGRVGLADRAGEKAAELAYGHQRLLEVAMGLGSTRSS
jgi:branched-chain amino acid transport system ATP-binding protein